MAQVSVAQAVVLGAMHRIREGVPVPGREVSGDVSLTLTATEQQAVLQVLADYVRIPEFRSPSEWSGSHR